MILSFRLTYTPAIFQAIINHILKKYIDRIVVVYLNDIFIFNKTLEKHKEHIYLILTALKQANLYINIYKSTFYSQEVDYLRFKIQPKIIEINNKKIKAIKYWLQPTNIKEIRGFLKFANFYQRFVKGFGQLTILFIELIKNNKAFE